MKKPSPSTSKDDGDEVLGDAQALPPLVPDGDYTGVFKRVETGPYQGRKRYFLWFAINEAGSFLNKELYLSCPFPKEGGTVFSQSSNLVKAYAIAMDGAPRRRDRISTKVFKNKVFKFRTRTVSTDSDGMPKKLADRYSVIHRLLNVEAGK